LQFDEGDQRMERTDRDHELEPLTRSAELPVPADELWALVADGAAWDAWLVDEAAVEVRPGSGGQVLDGGQARTVVVDEVTERDGERRVVFRWWPEDGLASRVTLVVAPRPGGASVLHVREVPVGTPRAVMSSRPAVAGVALVRLWLLASTLARV
jgi:uncharacterized protein YndB with AHSA1/START domain